MASRGGRRWLGALADEAGILPAYRDTRGRVHITADATRVALLAAMGLDASSERAARASLAWLRDRRTARLVMPVRVVRAGTKESARLMLHVPPDLAKTVEWHVRLHFEDGGVASTAGRSAVRVARGGRKRCVIPLPQRPGPGYHRLDVLVHARGGERQATQWLIVAPSRCAAPPRDTGGGPVPGLMAALFALHSDSSWGVGDFGDLRRLVAWCAKVGLDFALLNPLHAVGSKPPGISPYSPLSRQFFNVAYLNVHAVPEFRHCAAAQRLVDAPAFRKALRRLRASEQIDYAGVARVKMRALKLLYRCFLERKGTQAQRRRTALAAYRAARGEALERYATYMALTERMAERGCAAVDWRGWPAAYRSPDSAAVADFRRRAQSAIGFHIWLQFEAERQLSEAARAARRRGMRIGVGTDLALGVPPGSADTWAWPGFFADGAHLGAPPDDFAPHGQNWHLAPLIPHGLEEGGLLHWAAVVRANMRHAGAIRIDHAMGVLRQFWIPAEMSPAEGAYVRYPAEALLGIVALESVRNGTVVIGEDLGTVPQGFAARLARWGILSWRVLYFQRTRSGTFLAPRRYPRRALVSANTHDLPSLAALWYAADLDLRRDLGMLTATLWRKQKRARREMLARLVARLRASGCLESNFPRGPEEFVAAVYRFLARTPAALLGISLDDIVLEERPVNVPGATAEQYPHWRRRLRVPLEDLERAPFPRTLIHTVRREVRRRDTRKGPR